MGFVVCQLSQLHLLVQYPRPLGLPETATVAHMDRSNQEINLRTSRAHFKHLKFDACRRKVLHPQHMSKLLWVAVKELDLSRHVDHIQVMAIH